VAGQNLKNLPIAHGVGGALPVNFPAYSKKLNFFPLFENFGGEFTHSAPYMFARIALGRALRVSLKI
jgi:hypothetical protein